MQELNDFLNIINNQIGGSTWFVFLLLVSVVQTVHYYVKWKNGEE